MTDWLNILPEVQDALDAARPVVALESTLIAHGLPQPINLDVARQLEAIVREAGAVPATIALIGGRIQVGLEPGVLEYLARASNVRKVSRRDLPIVAAQRGDGATTVAATMWVAAQAGIQVFATGGIGGVHRGQPFDVSADLPELARTPVAVVCAGAKAILDLPLTLEWLETHGVPVIGYQCDELPAFYSRRSGLPVDVRAEDAEQAAAIIKTKWRLESAGGVLVVAPVPAEMELDAARSETAIQSALHAAEAAGIRGKALTPFLLERVSELTGGASRRANIALLANNARLAAQLARALLRLS
ncbi:MAG TPA: pseudouridine-5'-phosphate glycosidase [Anaerolineae bacterium]|nr:pseudouridine-5'-phosphate glycosidase [Anaerolineae bacterium]